MLALCLHADRENRSDLCQSDRGRPLVRTLPSGGLHSARRACGVRALPHYTLQTSLRLQGTGTRPDVRTPEAVRA